MVMLLIGTYFAVMRLDFDDAGSQKFHGCYVFVSVVGDKST